MSRGRYIVVILVVALFGVGLMYKFSGNMLAFLCAGIIPGTDYSLSPSAMLLFYAAILWTLVLRGFLGRKTQPVRHKKAVAIPRRRLRVQPDMAEPAMPAKVIASPRLSA